MFLKVEYDKTYGVISPDKKFMYCNIIIPSGLSLSTVLGSKRGTAMFDSNVIVPALIILQLGTISNET